MSENVQNVPTDSTPRDAIRAPAVSAQLVRQAIIESGIVEEIVQKLVVACLAVMTDLGAECEDPADGSQPLRSGVGGYADDALLSVDDVAKMLQVSRALIARMSGNYWRAFYSEKSEDWRSFPDPVRMGRAVRYRKSDILEWVEKRKKSVAVARQSAPNPQEKVQKRARGRKRRDPKEISEAVAEKVFQWAY